MKIYWKWYSFNKFSSPELYAILRLRQQIFVVEQQCAYLDSDNLDQHCYHLAGWYNTETHTQPIAYLRILPQESKGKLPTIGRVLIRLDFRKKGIGREIMQRGLSRIEELYPGSPVRISAQLYLTSFYQSLGFVKSSDKYDEDGIPHIEMIRSPDDSEGLRTWSN